MWDYVVPEGQTNLTWVYHKFPMGDSDGRRPPRDDGRRPPGDDEPRDDEPEDDGAWQDDPWSSTVWALPCLPLPCLAPPPPPPPGAGRPLVDSLRCAGGGDGGCVAGPRGRQTALCCFLTI